MSSSRLSLSRDAWSATICDLRAMLRRLQLPASAPVPLESQATNSQLLTIEAFLAQLTLQGYFDNLRVAQPLRGRAGRSMRAQRRRLLRAMTTCRRSSGGGAHGRFGHRAVRCGVHGRPTWALRGRGPGGSCCG
ncbi:hypothetical protein BD310DRAFT_942070 [Dichomitus squalens]|uniref:Uncharacterized protein n=1 Tax=Dichomitus squalens TaxID=114155 RepID=A0A4Q9PE40_9APHY|nr:hypothetical protein BD310DRAFT_942070 [Dichomitus squalens]